MDKREEILLATLELASQKGLGSVSLGQIADRVGIKKPSLYNHFSSKDEIIKELYVYLRRKAKSQLPPSPEGISELVKDRSAYEVLMMSVKNYGVMNSDETMMKFYRVIYSQRSLDPTAAQIVAEETKKMIAATKALFYALSAHKKIECDDIDSAAFSFAMSVHSILDYMTDCKSFGQQTDDKMLSDHIKWFCTQIGGQKNE